jgi:hypothetical protein
LKKNRIYIWLGLLLRKITNAWKTIPVVHLQVSFSDACIVFLSSFLDSNRFVAQPDLLHFCKLNSSNSTTHSNSTQSNSAQLNSTYLASIQLNSINSPQPQSTQINSTQLHSTQNNPTNPK